MKKTKKLAVILLAMIMTLGLASCGGGGDVAEEDGAATLNVVQQHGLAYIPLQIMVEQELVQKHYDGEVTVNYSTLNSGSAITEGFISGDIDLGGMGVAPAIKAVLQTDAVKICSNMSSQPHKLMTSDPSIKTLEDVGDKQIALVNIDSIQHIFLAMAAQEQLGDARALDNNIAVMAHPDGMSSLISGSISLHLTTAPYVQQEEAEGMTEVEALGSVWPEGNSFIVAVASNQLKEENPELYDAVVAALAEAIDYINNNKETVAEDLCESYDVDAETMLAWLNDPACGYSTETKGVLDMAAFMAEFGFLEMQPPTELSHLAFDNVTGN